MKSRSTQTVAIEQRLQDGQSVSSIAREFGLSRARIHHIKNRINGYSVTVTPLQPHQAASVDSQVFMKHLTLKLTTPMYDALVEACAIANRKDPDDAITVEDYAEECVVTKLVELGLVRKYRRK